MKKPLVIAGMVVAMAATAWIGFRLGMVAGDSAFAYRLIDMGCGGFRNFVEPCRVQVDVNFSDTHLTEISIDEKPIGYVD